MRAQPAVHSHGQLHRGHSKARCLKVLQHVSAFLDDELPRDICKEIRKHLGACPNCEVFLGSLQQTVKLCQHAASDELSPSLRARLRVQILKAAGHS